MANPTKEHPKWIDHTEVQIAKVRAEQESTRHIADLESKERLNRQEKFWTFLSYESVLFVLVVVSLSVIGSLAYTMVLWAQHAFK